MNSESNQIRVFMSTLDNLIDTNASISKFKNFEKEFFEFLKNYNEPINVAPYGDPYGDTYTLARIILDYCNHTNNKNKDIIESLIIRLPSIALEYCEEVRGRWPEFELFVLKNKEIVDDYALRVVKERWPEYEPILLESNSANNILSYMREWSNRERWTEAEPILFKDAESALEYCLFLESRIPEAEKIILSKISLASDYQNHFKFLWPEYENKIKTKPKRMLDYAKCLNARLPDELHNRMIMYQMMEQHKDICSCYFDFLKDCEDSIIKYLRSLDNDKRNELLRKL